MFSDPKGRELPFFRVVRVPVRRDGITLPGGREIPCLLMHFPKVNAALQPFRQSLHKGFSYPRTIFSMFCLNIKKAPQR